MVSKSSHKETIMMNIAAQNIVSTATTPRASKIPFVGDMIIAVGNGFHAISHNGTTWSVFTHAYLLKKVVWCSMVNKFLAVTATSILTINADGSYSVAIPATLLHFVSASATEFLSEGNHLVLLQNSDSYPSFVSNDGGVTWISSPPAAGLACGFILLDNVEANSYTYALSSVGVAGDVRRSYLYIMDNTTGAITISGSVLDATRTWVGIARLYNYRTSGAMVAVSLVGACYYSLDSGSTWTVMNGNASFNAETKRQKVFFDGEQLVFIVGNDSAIGANNFNRYYTSKNGLDVYGPFEIPFLYSNSNLDITNLLSLISIEKFGENHIAFLSGNGRYSTALLTSDLTTGFGNMRGPQGSNEYNFGQVPLRSAYVVSTKVNGRSCFVSVDAFTSKFSWDGLTWITDTGPYTDLTTLNITDVIKPVVTKSGRIVVAAYQRSTAMYSDDGRTWKSSSWSPVGSEKWIAMAYHPSMGAKGTICILGRNGDTCISTDEGTTWTTVAGTGTPRLGNIKTWCVLCPVGARFLAIDSTGWYSFSNDGMSWNNLNIGAGSFSIPGSTRAMAACDLSQQHVVVVAGNAVYAVTTSGDSVSFALTSSTSGAAGYVGTTSGESTIASVTDVIFDGNVFIPIRQNSNQVATSTTGLPGTWSTHYFPTFMDWKSITPSYDKGDGITTPNYVYTSVCAIGNASAVSAISKDSGVSWITDPKLLT
jgi:hypothetical protein